jgi:carboxymethylenebutenolidase
VSAAGSKRWACLPILARRESGVTAAASVPGVPDLALPYFLATPQTPEPGGPGVVVIHEGNGISSQLLRFCQRLAAEGYVVVAPDLFFRVGGTESDDAMTLIRGLDFAQAGRDIQEAARIAREHGANKLGVTGFCMGGSLTYQAAMAGGFDAAAGFYGAFIANGMGEPKCPTLLFFGGNDPWIPAADIEKVAANHADTFVYPEAGHGFMRDGSEDFAPEAAADAWDRTLTLFRQQLS